MKEEDTYKYFKLDGPLMLEATDDGKLKILRLGERDDENSHPSKRIRLLVKDLFLQVDGDGDTEADEPSVEFWQEIKAGDPSLEPFMCIMHPSGEPPCTKLITEIDLSK